MMTSVRFVDKVKVTCFMRNSRTKTFERSDNEQRRNCAVENSTQMRVLATDDG